MDARATLDHPLISERYFFPTINPPPNPTIVQCPDGARLNCFVGKSAPWSLLHFHGNGEIVGHYVPDVAQLFEGLGLRPCFAEYRGYGGSSDEPRLGTMLLDVGELFSAFQLDPAKTIVFGRSVGSIFAIEAVHRFPCAGLIIESGIADPFQRLEIRVTDDELGLPAGGLEAAVGELLDHETKLSGFTGAQLVLHAQNDDLVDVSHAHRVHEWSGAHHKEIEIFDRGDHNTIMGANLQSYWAAVAAFVQSVQVS